MARRTLRDPLQEQRWRRLLQDWKTSGLSRSQFCRNRQLSVNTLRFARVEGCFRKSSCDSVVQVRRQIPEGEEAFLHPGQGRE